MVSFLSVIVRVSRVVSVVLPQPAPGQLVPLARDGKHPPLKVSFLSVRVVRVVVRVGYCFLTRDDMRGVIPFY